MDAGRGTSHAGSVRGWRARRGTIRECGARGGIASEEIPNADDRVLDAANHHGTYTPV